MRFIKKPVEVEAILWTGGNFAEIRAWMMMNNLPNNRVLLNSVKYKDLIILTLDGTMTATEGDWIIRGVKGEIYPCKPDIFDLTYEKIEVAS